MRFQPDFVKRFKRAGMAFFFCNARKRHRKFHVFLNRQVRNQIVTLEDEADTLVAIIVPVKVVVFFRGAAVDDDVARRAFVQPADYVQKGCFATAGMAEYCHEFLFAELDRDAFQDVYDVVVRLKIFFNFFKSQHKKRLPYFLILK